MFQTTVPLHPKDPDGKLRVIVIGRISTEHQKVESIDASFRYVQEYLARMYEGPTEIECLGERASGMLADRATIRRTEELITGGRVDVVIAEDLSRIYRNPRLQYDFVQNAVDNGCRVICIADNLDTGTDHWELALGAAAFRHGMFIPDVRRRVRRTATHAFHNGGMVLMIRYGYRRLSKEEAATGHFGPKGLRIAKVPECTKTIRQMCRWVHEGASYVRIAERLNQAGICPGPYAKHQRWSSANVTNLLRDPVLSGTRRFRVILYEPVYGTGKHRRKKCEQPETKVYPELAHLSSAEQEDLWRVMDERGLLWRVPINGAAKRLNVPRSKSLWPGQAATCDICGGRMYDMGRFLKCHNALPAAIKPCWNHVQVPLEVTRQKIINWLFAQRSNFPWLHDWLANRVSSELQRVNHGVKADRMGVERRLSELRAAASNLAKAIAKGGELDILLSELSGVQAELDNLETTKLHQTAADTRDRCELLSEWSELELKARLLRLLGSSYEFADVFRTLFTEFRVIPVQALDTPLVRPRSKLTANFARLRDGPPKDLSGDDITISIDLFEPPAHIRWLNSCLQIKTENPIASLKQIARRLDIGHMTVKRAFGYARLMQAAGTTEPYRELCQQPLVASRWRQKTES